MSFLAAVFCLKFYYSGKLKFPFTASMKIYDWLLLFLVSYKVIRLAKQPHHHDHYESYTHTIRYPTYSYTYKVCSSCGDATVCVFSSVCLTCFSASSSEIELLCTFTLSLLSCVHMSRSSRELGFLNFFLFV